MLRTPGLLNGEIKLVNAVPVTGFLNQATEGGRDYQNDYIRSGRLSVKTGSMDRLLSTFKEGMSILSSLPEIRSFLVFQALDEVDTVYTWARYESRQAFDEMQKSSEYSKLMGEIKSLLEGEEMTSYRVAGGYLSNQ